MKKFFLLLLFIFALVFGAWIMNEKHQVIDTDDLVTITKKSIPKIKSDEDERKAQPLLEGNLFDFIGKETDELTDQLGEPDRKDKSAYGYTWWIYTDGKTTYTQFGVDDHKIVTLFATGEDLSTEPFAMGDAYEKVNDHVEFKDELTYSDGLDYYKFVLNEDNLKSNPLIKIGDDVFAQLYFDTFENELSSIRVLTGDMLLQQRIYEMEYRGHLPEELVFDEKEWEEIEAGMEKQIFDLTNVYRERFHVSPLTEDENVHQVAYLHSKDMNDNNYFSHETEDGDGLKERLEEKNIYYMSAGENIAAQHTDGPAAMEGWLNSEGHREALLNEEYTHLGVGVSQLYYTQNFLSKP